MTEPSHKERAHAPNSPSQLWIRELCPASKQAMLAVRDLPQEPSDAADRGTLCHEAMEKYGRAWVPGVQAYEVLKYAPAEGIDDEDRDALVWCAEWLNGLLHGIGILPERAFEQAIDLRFLGTDVGVGLPDVVIVEPLDYAMLIDYKFGVGFVESPKNNRQFQAYALGLMRKYALKQVVCYLIMPKKQQAISEAIDCRDYNALSDRIKAINDATCNSTVRLNPGWYCDWCAGAAACPVAQRGLAIFSGAQLAEVPKDLPTEKLATLLDMLPAVEKAAKDLKALAKARLQDAGEGAQIGEYYLGTAGKSRSWSDKAQVAEMFAQHEQKRDLISIEPASPAQAEKILGKEYYNESLKVFVKESPMARALRRRKGPKSLPSVGEEE